MRGRVVSVVGVELDLERPELRLLRDEARVRRGGKLASRDDGVLRGRLANVRSLKGLEVPSHLGDDRRPAPTHALRLVGEVDVAASEVFSAVAAAEVDESSVEARSERGKRERDREELTDSESRAGCASDDELLYIPEDRPVRNGLLAAISRTVSMCMFARGGEGTHVSSSGATTLIPLGSKCSFRPRLRYGDSPSPWTARISSNIRTEIQG